MKGTSGKKSQNARITDGTRWEEIVGYCRAVRTGNMIEVAGTVAVDESGNPVGLGDPYAQTRFIIQKAEKAIASLGGGLQDVVRTRIFTTDISSWQEIGKAHGEFFSQIKPASTMVEVSRLIFPEYLVEIEFTAQIEQT
jgi:enamine deaminase RidA (YjgF/YER057c/UK114 family)